MQGGYFGKIVIVCVIRDSAGRLVNFFGKNILLLQKPWRLGRPVFFALKMECLMPSLRETALM